MSKLTTAQIKGLAYGVGFDENQASIMTAIALAESGGVTDRHNPVPPDDSYGLWQINMYGALGPARLKALGLTSNSQLYTPGLNAAAAKYVFSQQGFSAWSTYGGPSYKLFISKAKAAKPDSSMISQGSGWNQSILQLLNIPGADTLKNLPGDAASAVSNSSSAITAIGNATVKAGDWLSNATNWLRILYVGGGAVVLLLAMQSLFKPVTDAAIGGTAKTAATIAKAVK